MEYRGFEYAIVRTIPNGWRWSVSGSSRDKAGETPDRDSAVMCAQRYIDRLVRLQVVPEKGAD